MYSYLKIMLTLPNINHQIPANEPEENVSTLPFTLTLYSQQKFCVHCEFCVRCDTITEFQDTWLGVSK